MISNVNTIVNSTYFLIKNSESLIPNKGYKKIRGKGRVSFLNFDNLSLLEIIPKHISEISSTWQSVISSSTKFEKFKRNYRSYIPREVIYNLVISFELLKS